MAALAPGSPFSGRRFRRQLQCLVRMQRLPEALGAIDAAIGQVDTAAVAAAAAVGTGFVPPGAMEARSLGNVMRLSPQQVVDLYVTRLPSRSPYHVHRD